MKINAAIPVIFFLAFLSVYSHAQTVGGDKDKHGCLASAGYEWSGLRGKCVRMWEEGLQLKATKGDTTLAAYVILSTGKKKAEVFLPGKEPFIMLKQGQGKFVFKNYTLQQKQGWQLKERGNLIYASSALLTGSNALAISPQDISAYPGKVTFSQKNKVVFYYDATSKSGTIIINGKSYQLDKFLFDHDAYTMSGNGVSVTTNKCNFKHTQSDCFYGTVPKTTVRLGNATTVLSNLAIQDCGTTN